MDYLLITFLFFYAFFISTTLVLLLVYKKKYKIALGTFACLLSSALLSIVIFPSCLNHLTKRTGTGTTSLEYLSTFSLSRLKYLVFTFARGYKTAVIIGLILIVTVVVIFKRIKKSKFKDLNIKMLLITIPTFFAFVFITLFSNSVRYLANIAPMFVYIIGYLAFIISKEVNINGYVIKLFYLLAIIICVISSITTKPDYLYLEHKEYNNKIELHKDSLCIYVTSNSNPSITQDLPQLINFDRIIVVDSLESELLKNNIINNNEVVVYFAKYPESIMKDDSIEALSSLYGLKDKEFLYDNGWSEAYRLYK